MSSLLTSAAIWDVELAGPVHLQHRAEVLRVLVEEELGRVAGDELLAQLQHVRHAGAGHQPPQPRAGEPQE